MRLWHIGGTPWDNPEAWRERSVRISAHRDHRFRGKVITRFGAW
jgi:hypothetical protein